MTLNGFQSRSLSSPFAYRYPTPFTASLLIDVFNLSLLSAYKVIAYTGCILQLSGIFFLVYYFSKSTKAAFLSLVVTAFTLMNIKFLLFDVYRPDHLAYFFVIVAMYFALTKKFYALLITVMIGVQFREFVIAPLIAFMLNVIIEKNKKEFIRYILPTAIGLLISIVIPRILIPVVETRQYLNTDSILNINFYKHAFNPKRLFNFTYSIIAYFLPVLMLITKSRLSIITDKYKGEKLRILLCYSAVILILMCIGGTDLTRFVTYFFIIQVLLIAAISDQLHWPEILFMLTAIFIFNRIWLHIPMMTAPGKLDFYPGYSNKINISTLERIAEISLFIFLSMLIRRKYNKRLD